MEQTEHRKKYLRDYSRKYYHDNEHIRDAQKARHKKRHQEYIANRVISEEKKLSSLGWYCKYYGTTKTDIMKVTKTNRTYLQQWFNNEEFNKLNKVIKETICQTEA